MWALLEEESELIVKLCKAVDFQKDISWLDDGTNFVKAIEELWQTACHIGYEHGMEDASADSGSDSAPGAQVVDMQKELERERVWGFDVGWNLCAELKQSRASQASLVPSSPSPRSVSVAATQTDAVAVTPVVVVATAAAAEPAPLDWAEDAATLPTFPLHSKSPPSTTRDFSALHTGSPQPFASLQRRRRRAPRPPTSSLQNHPQQRRRPQQKSGIHYAAKQRTPPSYSYPPPSIPFPASSFPPSDRPAAQFPLDWDQDPRLRDLGQALAALGWVRL